MSKSAEIKQEAEQLLREARVLNRRTIIAGIIALLATLVMFVALYLIFSNLFTALDDGGLEIIIGIALLVAVGVISLLLRKGQSRQKSQREQLERKVKELTAKKEALKKLQPADPGGTPPQGEASWPGLSVTHPSRDT